MELIDKTLICLECGAEFEFPVLQQQQFMDRGYPGEPKRCPTCRERRRLSQPQWNKPQPRRLAPIGRNRDDAPRQLHPATCSACGRRTEVPFKPIEGRPVYCRPCHLSQKSEGIRPRE